MDVMVYRDGKTLSFHGPVDLPAQALVHTVEQHDPHPYAFLAGFPGLCHEQLPEHPIPAGAVCFFQQISKGLVQAFVFLPQFPAVQAGKQVPPLLRRQGQRSAGQYPLQEFPGAFSAAGAFHHPGDRGGALIPQGISQACLGQAAPLHHPDQHFF